MVPGARELGTAAAFARCSSSRRPTQAPPSPPIQSAGWHHWVQVSRSPRTKVEKALVGPAGEHFVLYQLYRHGMLASLAPPGTPTVDILVLATDQSVVATVQVNPKSFNRLLGRTGLGQRCIEGVRGPRAWTSQEPWAKFVRLKWSELHAGGDRALERRSQ
jgi:hypothetical protein